MLFQVHTGFSSGHYELGDGPREGDIFHNREFVYVVAAVEWVLVPRSGIVFVLPTEEVDFDAEYGQGYNYGVTNVPRVGDVVRHQAGQFYRVSCVEWFVNQSAVPESYTRVHHDRNTEYQHPGIVAVMEGGQEYGKRFVEAGISPM